MEEQFYTILTKLGKSKLIEANVSGKKLDLIKFQIGDGNGSYYNPTEDQMELKHKVWEGLISNITVDENNPNWVVIETVLPNDIGSFMIREAGVFDAEGNLIAIGKYPETYKPVADEGSSKELVIKMILELSNSTSVTLKIDKSLAFSTKEDIERLDNKLETLKDDLSNENLTDFKTNKVINELKDSVSGFITDLNIKGKTLINYINTPITEKRVEVEFAYTVNYTPGVTGGKYTFINMSDKRITLPGWKNDKWDLVIDVLPHSKKVYNISRDINYHRIDFLTEDGWKKEDIDKFDKTQFMILEGDWTNKEIPGYFEDTQSVGEESNSIGIATIGKNLIELVQGTYYTTVLALKSQWGNFIENDLRITHKYGRIPVKPNTNYVLSVNNTNNLKYIITQFDKNRNIVSGNVWSEADVPSVLNIKTESITSHISLAFKFDDKTEIISEGYKIQLEEGTKLTKWEKCKTDSEFIGLSKPLMSIDNSIYDEIKNNKVIRRVKSKILDGSLNWSFGKSYLDKGYKWIKIPLSDLPHILVTSDESESHIVLNYKGTKLVNRISFSTGEPQCEYYNCSPELGNFGVTIHDTDSGWGENYTPTPEEIKAYFYGWRLYDGQSDPGARNPYNRIDGKNKWWINYDVSVSTHTLPQELSNNYTPYKIYYQLEKPIIENLIPPIIPCYDNCKLLITTNVIPDYNFKYPTNIGGKIESISNGLKNMGSSLDDKSSKKELIDGLNTKVNNTDYSKLNLYVGTTTGTSTAYIGTVSNEQKSYVDGQVITLVPHIDCGDNPTFNLNGIGAVNLVNQDENLKVGDMKANKPYSFVRVGSNFFIRSGGLNSPLPKWVNKTENIIKCKPMITPRGFTSVTTLDNNIYIIGGYISNSTHGTLSGEIEQYNCDTNTINKFSTMQKIVKKPMVNVIDKEIYCLSGEIGSYYQNTVQHLNTETKTWTIDNNMPITPYIYTHSVTVDKKIYVSFMDGGKTEHFVYYDTQLKTWQDLNIIQDGISMSILCHFGNCIYAFPNGYKKNVYKYDIISDQWSVVSQLPGTGVVIGSVFAIKMENYIYVSLDSGMMYSFNPSNNEWTYINNYGTNPIFGGQGVYASSVSFGNYKNFIYMIGGYNYFSSGNGNYGVAYNDILCKAF